MAKARAIVKRRKSVQNIRKITRTMQLIATARFQAALKRATASRPYTERISQLVAELSQSVGDVEHALLKENPAAAKAVVLVITSNRGLCGGYNGSLLRAASEQIRGLESEKQSIELQVVGKKGIAYFKYLRRPMSREFTQFDDRPQFAAVEPIADTLMDLYASGQVRSVHVTYMRFESVSKQYVETIPLLPLTPPSTQDVGKPSSVVYEFSPPPAELLAELLPEMVKVRLFQSFVDAAVSEQVARMVAMKSATDAAGDMIKSLTREYNRARQSQITLELLDIVSGAEALK